METAVWYNKYKIDDKQGNNSKSTIKEYIVGLRIIIYRHNYIPRILQYIFIFQLRLKRCKFNIEFIYALALIIPEQNRQIGK